MRGAPQDAQLVTITVAEWIFIGPHQPCGHQGKKPSNPRADGNLAATAVVATVIGNGDGRAGQPCQMHCQYTDDREKYDDRIPTFHEWRPLPSRIG